MCFALTGLVTTLAGSGSSAYADGQGAQASFRCPTGVAVDSMGTVYVGDYYGSRIRKVTSAGRRSGRWTWTIVCVCAVCCDEGRDIPTLATTAGTKNEIHSCICHARLVPICVKQILPSRTSCCSVSPGTSPTLFATTATATTIGVFYCVLLLSIRA